MLQDRKEGKLLLSGVGTGTDTGITTGIPKKAVNK